MFQSDIDSLHNHNNAKTNGNIKKKSYSSVRTPFVKSSKTNRNIPPVNSGYSVRLPQKDLSDFITTF